MPDQDFSSLTEAELADDSLAAKAFQSLARMYAEENTRIRENVRALHDAIDLPWWGNDAEPVNAKAMEDLKGTILDALEGILEPPAPRIRPGT